MSRPTGSDQILAGWGVPHSLRSVRLAPVRFRELQNQVGHVTAPTLCRVEADGAHGLAVSGNQHAEAALAVAGIYVRLPPRMLLIQHGQQLMAGLMQTSAAR